MSDYSIIELCGKDSVSIINGLSTNLIKQHFQKNISYSCILTHNGRFMYDYFFIEDAQNKKNFIAIHKHCVDSFIEYINKFKMDAEVIFIKTNSALVWNKNNGDFQDPRNQNLGFWSIVEDNQNNDNDYHIHRIKLNIADGYHDLTQRESIILDYGFDSLNAINYTKGCYLGQELIARTHHTGVIRKKIYNFYCENLIEKETDILQNDTKIGKVLGGCENHYLALIKFENFNKNEKVYISNIPNGIFIN